MMKTFKFKLSQAKRNRKLHRQINAAGLAYNHCIALHKRFYHLYHRSLHVYKLQKHLAQLKKIPKFSYLLELDSQVLQNIAERVDRGYKMFWRNLKKHKKTAPPKFRKIRKYKSITFKQSGWKLDETHGAIFLRKQKYRYAASRKIDGAIKMITVKRDSLGDIYIFICCELPESKVKARTGKSVGFDFGFKGKILVAENSKDDIKAPSFFNKQKKAIARENRHAFHKHLGSKNQKKTYVVLARLHRKVSNQRNDFHWKLAQALCKKYAVICLEDLDMKWMQRGHGRKVMDYGFSEFLRILEYVASQHSTRIVKVDRFFPSSQLCSKCGYQNPQVKDLRVRSWRCPKCGEHHDRDRNAAKNIHREGLRILT